jgi:hypothetical protein
MTSLRDHAAASSRGSETNIGKALRHHACYLDQVVSPLGQQLPKHLPQLFALSARHSSGIAGPRQDTTQRYRRIKKCNDYITSCLAIQPSARINSKSNPSHRE